jgi:arginine deiminase
MKPIQIRTNLEDLYQELYNINQAIEDAKYEHGSVSKVLKEAKDRLKEVIVKIEYLEKQL